jgi:hypothetical protein
MAAGMGMPLGGKCVCRSRPVFDPFEKFGQKTTLPLVFHCGLTQIKVRDENVNYLS